MDLPRWAEIMLLLVAGIVVVGIIAFVVTEVLMKRSRSGIKQRLAQKRRRQR
jgi:hypothetical protein